MPTDAELVLAAAAKWPDANYIHLDCGHLFWYPSDDTTGSKFRKQRRTLCVTVANATVAYIHGYDNDELLKTMQEVA